MISYAIVDRIEGKFAVCEVELIPIEKSQWEDSKAKETIICDVLKEEFMRGFEDVREGDVLIVLHDGQNVSFVYRKDAEEKQRRIEYKKRKAQARLCVKS